MFNKLWWDQVIEIPEESRIIVFNRGIIKGLKTSIIIGGHFIPNSINWINLKWKNLQKKDKKKKISEIINKIIPDFILKNTLNVWSPWNVLSRVISRHHWNMIIIIIIKVNINTKKFFELNNLIILINKIIIIKDLIKGQGL